MPISFIEATNAAMHEVMIKAPKVKENKEMECDEQIVCQGKYHILQT